MKDGFTDHRGNYSYQIQDDREGGYVSVFICPETVFIRDTHTHKVQSFKLPGANDEMEINTGSGNDVIHIFCTNTLSKPVSVHINVKGKGKMVTACNDPFLHVSFNLSRESDLYLRGDDPVTYESNIEAIRKWNERNRKVDGLLKRIKRKMVYFFGRDMKIRKPFFICNGFWKKRNRNQTADESANQEYPGYFTTTYHLAELESLAAPADILLRYQDGYPFDRFFVGTWQHAAIYYGQAKVIDAMGNGTYMRTLSQFAEADGIVLLRIEGISQKESNKVLAYALEQVGKSYSVDFNDSVCEQYCSGLVIHALQYAGIMRNDYFRNHAVHPDDLLKLEKMKVVWTNRSDLLKASLRA